MDKIMTETGSTLETLTPPAELRGLELALAWALLALLAAGTLLAAASLCQAAGCDFRPTPAETAPAAAMAGGNYEANWSRGIYGDELCGFIPEGNGK